MMKMLWKKFNYCNIFKRSAFSKTSVRIIFLQKRETEKNTFKKEANKIKEMSQFTRSNRI